MTRQGVLATVLLATMALAWWWALAPPPAGPTRAASGTPLASARPGRAPQAPDVPPVVALERLRQVPSAPVRGGRNRDPFGGAASSTPVALRPAGARGEIDPAAERARADAPTWPRIELIGIAERTADGTAARVAIIAGARGVHHAHAGEVVEQVYRVERVGADAIDVRLVPEDRLFRLALK